VRLRRERDVTDRAEVVVEAARDDELRDHVVTAAQEVLAAIGRARTVQRRHGRRRWGMVLGVAAGAGAAAAAIWRWRRGGTYDERPDVARPAAPHWEARATPSMPDGGSPAARPVAPEAFRAESPDTQVGGPALDVDELLSRRGQDVEDISGEKIGTLQDVYLDEPTGAPEWALVGGGTLRTAVWFVPLRGTRLLDGRLQVPFTKELVTEAPSMDADGRLSPNEEHQLYHHYGMNRQEAFRVAR